MVAKKATFQRHSKKNASQRQRNVTVVASILASHKKSVLKVKPKVNMKKVGGELTEKVVERMSNSNEPPVSLRQSFRNSPNKSTGALNSFLNVIFFFYKRNALLSFYFNFRCREYVAISTGQNHCSSQIAN